MNTLTANRPICVLQWGDQWKTLGATQSRREIPQFLIEDLTKEQRPLGEMSNFFERLSKNRALSVLRYLFDNPAKMKLFSKYYIKTIRLTIGTGGTCQHTFTHFTLNVVRNITAKHTYSGNVALKDAHQTSVIPTPTAKLTVKGTLVAKTNRTFVMCSKPNSKMRHAYKVMKPEESLPSFTGEASATTIYKKSKCFEDIFHTPIGVYCVDKLPKEFEYKETRSSYVVYHYKASKDYFIYAHDKENVADDEFLDSRLIAARFYTTQIRNGIYPSTGLNHNEENNRAYLPMIDTINQKRNQIFTVGAGRVNAPLKALKYTDVRKKMIADINDVVTIEQGSKDIKKCISSDMIHGKTEDETRNLLQMNALSLQWFNDSLIVALRLSEQKKLKWDDDDFCSVVGSSLCAVYVSSLQTYTNEPEEKCKTFALNANVHWKRMARQLMFWIDSGEYGYRRWIDKGFLPKTIYGKKIIVECKGALDSKNYKTGIGFSHDGVNIDIGSYNGILGLIEMEKAWAIFATFCVGLAEDKCVNRE